MSDRFRRGDESRPEGREVAENFRGKEKVKCNINRKRDRAPLGSRGGSLEARSHRSVKSLRLEDMTEKQKGGGTRRGNNQDSFGTATKRRIPFGKKKRKKVGSVNSERLWRKESILTSFVESS